MPDSKRTSLPDQAMRQSSLRDANLALACRVAFASETALSRADVATATGMTRSTVSRLVDDLVSAGFLIELPKATGGGPGRPAVPLRPAPRTMVALGMEINVNHLSVRVVDLTGAVLHENYTERRCAGEPPELVLGWMHEMVRRALDAVPGIPLVAADLAVPGLVDRSSGTLLEAPNLGWRGVQPHEALADLIAVDLRVGNEADYAAWTVSHLAPGRPGPWPSFLYVSGETGIGGSVVRGGEMDPGDRGWAGEIGHLTIDPNGPPCPCGSTGCLERYVGQTALLAAAEVSTLEELIAKLSADDAEATQVVHQAGDALGIGLGAAINLIDLPRAVLGGHLATLGTWIIPRVQDQLAVRVLSSPWRKIDVEVVSLDPAPASLGCAVSGLTRLINWPARLAPGQ